MGRFSTAPQKRKVKKASEPSHKNSLKIFEKVVRQQAAQEKRATAAAESRDRTAEGVEYYTNLAKLRPMMKQQNMEDCLDFFLTNLWNKSPYEGRNRLLKQRGAFLMSKVAEAKMANFDSKRLPSVSQITQYFYEMDSLGAKKWSDMMMALIRAILAKSAVRTEYESDEAYASAKLRKEELVEDLVDSWILFHRHRMSADSSTLQSSEEAEFRLPDIDLHRLKQFSWETNYKGALGCIFPNWISQVRQIPAVAIATFVLLVDDDHSTVSARQKAKPLLVPIGHVVSACPIKQPALAEMLGPYPTILLYVLKQWDTVIKRLHRRQGNNEVQQHITEAIVTRGNLTRPYELNDRDIIAKIRSALSMSDTLMLEAMWREFWNPDREEKQPRMRNHPRIFNQFIMAFTALQKPNRAIDVWDVMISIGLTPTLGTWSGMIEGCRKCRNGAGIENVWRKLAASGLPLNEAVWTTRVMGLMEAGEPNAALRALHEMLKMSKLPGGVPLSITTVNATVTGLLRLNAKSAVSKVLLWASEHGIEPDVFTYNILLGPLVKDGQAAEIKSTLKLMSANNIKPNAATYTILLEGLISNIHDLAPAQQRLRVEQLLADMDADGVDANQENFGRMLHIILRNGNNIGSHTEGAVGAIFRHIGNQGTSVSPHILTILVDHYFTRTPPAIENIDLLLRQHKDSVVDRVFWEHVIRGYALAGATDRAFTWFEKTYFTTYIITLDTIEILLRALVKDGKWAAAARVVDNMKQHQGASIGSVNNSTKHLAPKTRWDRYWRHGFWAYAMDCGLLGAAEWRRMAEASRKSDSDATGSLYE